MFEMFRSLRGPLRRFEAVIDEIIVDIGVEGKLEEFKQEGRKAVYEAEGVLHSGLSETQIDIQMYEFIRKHLLSFLPR